MQGDQAMAVVQEKDDTLDLAPSHRVVDLVDKISIT